jgi:hypothetical protein
MLIHLHNMKYITLFLLIICSPIYAQRDTIILEQNQYQVYDNFRFTVQAKKPTAFGLNGACSGGGLVYKIFKITESGAPTLVYDNTGEIMDCGLPYTSPVDSFKSQLLVGIKQPGKYYIVIQAKGRDFKSAIFTIVPLQAANYYGMAEFRDSSYNFPNEQYFTQIQTYLSLEPSGKYTYNYGSMLSGEGFYTVKGDSITFNQTKGENANPKNIALLLNGAYRFSFQNGWLFLSKAIRRDSYRYTFMKVPTKYIDK